MKKDRRSGPFLSSFTLAMREAFIILLQHYRRLLSLKYCLHQQRFWSFALTVREAFVILLQHFQRLLSVVVFYPRLSCPLRTIV